MQFRSSIKYALWETLIFPLWIGLVVRPLQNYCALIESVRDAFLTQMVSKPTRRRADQKPSLVDLVLVNCEDFISEIEHHCSLGKGDHDVRIFSLQGLLSAAEKDKREFFNYKKGDYNKIRQSLSEVNWSVLEGENVEEN